MQNNFINKVFVYGTLKRGFCNQDCIPNNAISTIQPAKLQGTLYYISSGAFPCLTLTGDNTIHGELYTIHKRNWKKILRQMDILEGVPILYKRKLVKVSTPNGIEKCWAYIINGTEDLGPEIESGEFTGRLIQPNRLLDYYRYFEL